MLDLDQLARGDELAVVVWEREPPGSDEGFFDRQAELGRHEGNEHKVPRLVHGGVERISGPAVIAKDQAPPALPTRTAQP